MYIQFKDNSAFKLSLHLEERKIRSLEESIRSKAALAKAMEDLEVDDLTSFSKKLGALIHEEKFAVFTDEDELGFTEDIVRGIYNLQDGYKKLGSESEFLDRIAEPKRFRRIQKGQGSGLSKRFMDEYLFLEHSNQGFAINIWYFLSPYIGLGAYSSYLLGPPGSVLDTRYGLWDLLFNDDLDFGVYVFAVAMDCETTNQIPKVDALANAPCLASNAIAEKVLEVLESRESEMKVYEYDLYLFSYCIAIVRWAALDSVNRGTEPDSAKSLYLYLIRNWDIRRALNKNDVLAEIAEYMDQNFLSLDKKLAKQLSVDAHY